MGWPREPGQLIDEDLGLSGARAAHRRGFARLTAEGALARVGILRGLAVSRLARKHADWDPRLDLGAMTDTLIGEADGLYPPARFNDRLVLGLKGTRSEAERPILRARLEGGIRTKAARGERRRGRPGGLVWGEEEGEVRFPSNQAVTSAIRAVFERVDEFGSAPRVWLGFRSQGLGFPLQSNPLGDLQGVAPADQTIHSVLTPPV